MTTARQAQLDEMTFNLYVDCGRSYAEAARQWGISASTVRGRVRRHNHHDALAAAARRAAEASTRDHR